MATSISKSFGRIIRERRMTAKLSQEKLAEKAALHPTYISMIERGTKNPTLDVAARIADALDSNLAQLVAEAQERGATVKRRKP